MRPSGRALDEKREVKFTRHYTKHAEGSVFLHWSYAFYNDGNELNNVFIIIERICGRIVLFIYYSENNVENNVAPPQK